MAQAGVQHSMTLRTDAWWVAPLVTFVMLSAFVVYTTWRIIENQYYLAEPYLSPLYSPLLLLDWWPLSPAILILWAPGGFRLTCYYYRKAYYRSFIWTPPACAVDRGKPGEYCGETRFPLILQNLHRYFFYAAGVVLVFLWYDAFKAFVFDEKFGVGVGSIVLLLNAALLTMYSLSCHSFRHMIGGKLNVFSKCPTRFMLWKAVSGFNEHHMFWAWFSLIVVSLTDLYVRLVASGAIQDVRFI
ncbi:MAG: succinate dehydrogenase [Thermodesulfobacteriota bacterium]